MPPAVDRRGGAGRVRRAGGGGGVGVGFRVGLRAARADKDWLDGSSRFATRNSPLILALTTPT